MRYFGYIVLLLLLLASAVSSAQDTHSALDNAFALSEGAIAQTRNGEFVVQIQEQIKGKLRGQEIVHGYFTSDPARLYFHWLEGGLNAGLQASHDVTRDGPGRFVALDAGIAGLVGVRSYKADGAIVDKINPHRLQMPDYNLKYLVAMVKDIVTQGKGAGESKVRIRNQTLHGVALDVYTVEFSSGYAYRKIEIGFACKSKLPHLIKLYNEKGEICADYLFKSLKTNIPLDNSVFTLKKI